ncbi:molybdopterin-dependent oxidoreductase [Chloroflexota bacterium]
MTKGKQEVLESGVTIIRTGCCHDCGGRCVLRAHVKDGRIIRIETDNGEEPQLRACLRGRAYRQRVYSPERLKYPLRRLGERGQGLFERISWDEALGKVASELIRVKKTYGNSAILLHRAGGSTQGILHGHFPISRLLLYFSGYTRSWGSASYEGALYASMATYGTIRSGNSRADLLNSKLIIMWSWNPANTIQDPGTSLALAKAREKGIRIVGVDPRCTDTMATFADQWIPIRPNTDAAMLIAMAYVIVTGNLQDQAFIDKYTVGFDKYRDYLLGVEDGIPKTPEWAEAICGVPAEVIANLAREYATRKPSALIAGWGAARTGMGEQYARAACVLTAITGNIGIKGGSAAGFGRAYSSRESTWARGPRNKVEEGAPHFKNSLYKLRGGTNPSSARIHRDDLPDAIMQGRAGGFPADIKLAYIGNFINSESNTNLRIKALKALEFIVIQEQFMTPTAKFADIVLPVNTFMERSDIAPPWLGAPYYIFLNKAIESLDESKTDLEICMDLSKRLGIPEAFDDRTEEQWLREIAASRNDIPDYEALKHDGVVKIKLPEPVVAFKKQIEDPEHNPFPTLSGKIEIYSEHMAEWNDPMLPPIPKYISPAENYDDPLTTKYPLQLITPHYKTRAHSIWHKVPWTREVEPQSVWVSIADAEARGIKDSDMVDVYNDRGRVRIPVRVTGRIIPGTVSIGEGAWYDPDKDGVDHGGCANVLTSNLRSPGGALSMNTVLVQVELSPKTGGGK